MRRRLFLSERGSLYGLSAFEVESEYHAPVMDVS